MTGYVIPYYGLKRQYENIKDELLEATNNVLKTGELLEGYYTHELEKWLGERLMCFAISCHSGTQALEIIATYLRQHLHNPVAAIPNISYPSTVNAFVTAGYDIDLVDTNEFGIINTDKIIRPNDVTVVVGLYGLDPHKYVKANLNNSKFLVFDGTHHWLCLTKRSYLGLATSISFSPTRNLNSSGNGGAILTDSEELYDFVKNFRNNGGPLHKCVGTNSKMSEINCAHTLVRSKYIDEWQIKRKKIATYWNDRFRNLPIKTLCDTSVANSFYSYTIYASERLSLRGALTVAGVDTKIIYENTLSEMIAYKHYNNPSAFSTSYMLTKGVLSLPIYPELYDVEVEFIADTIINFFK